MKHISHISVPQPCSQNWDSMLPDNEGKFCSNCQKNVIDFSGLSNTEILHMLSSSIKVCGRFNPTQLMVLNHAIAPKTYGFIWQKIGLAAAIITAIPFVNAQARVKPITEQNPAYHGKQKTFTDTSLVYKKIAGKVTDGKDNLIGAVISVKGTQIHTMVGADGNFILNVPTSTDVTLVVTFIGYKQKEVKIDANQNTPCIIEMKEQMALLGEVVVIRRPPIWKRPYYAARRVVRKIFN